MKAGKAKPADSLKPCPFCGSSGDTLELTSGDWRDVPKSYGIRPESNPVFWCVQCVACYSGGPDTNSRSEACVRWNEWRFSTSTWSTRGSR
jgi:Restriction alleviation protein Lar